MLTHETFIHSIRDTVLDRIPSTDRRRSYLANAKLTYGVGSGNVRGVTYYDAWSRGKDESKVADFIEICATGEENPVQLAGTVIHELAHVLAGYGVGHGQGWFKACEELGLKGIKAAGTIYTPDNFYVPCVRWRIYHLIAGLSDGLPRFGGNGGFIGLPAPKLKPCPLGIGTRGGTSRGAGSGSRLVLYTCSCDPVVKVRAAKGAKFDATCNRCGQFFLSTEERDNLGIQQAAEQR